MKSQGSEQRSGGSANVQTEQACPRCGMEREDWPNEKGFRKQGQVYCCQGCADNVGCTCETA